MNLESFTNKLKCINRCLKGNSMDGIFDNGLFDREAHVILKKEAEMIALQSQINPHFLYNTLEAIRSEALMNDQDEIAEMIEALAEYFRYSISQKGQFVTLREEILSVENYFRIQKFRFGDRINLEILWEMPDDEVMGFQIPKLVLQPIVENSIYHGLEPKMGVGTITIRIIRSTERLNISIQDDGVGMSYDQLKFIKEKMRENVLSDISTTPDQRGGLALKNVNNRIRLFYGAEYGIQVKSALSIGSEIDITLPIIKSGESHEA